MTEANKPAEAPKADAAKTSAPSVADREVALAERRLALQEQEMETAELELAQRRAAALASGKPATIAADGPDPAELARAEDRDARRHELTADRILAKSGDERRAIAREVFSLEADDLADLAADLAAHGSSLTAVLRKAAHNAFGIAI